MPYKFTLFFLITFFCFVFLGCENGGQPDYKSLPSMTSKGILAVVEIPAGSNRKIEYRSNRSRFEVDVIDGKERVIDFLPYPGNYGFIPSTLMDKNQEGDGDAMDILIISESLETGDTISVIPIGALILKDEGEIDTKIIAVPANPSMQIMQVTDYQTFTVKYNGAKRIIENWFLNYKGLGETELIGWKNDRYALQEIKKWGE